VAFEGVGENGQEGIYAAYLDDGPLTLVADLNTPVPMGNGSFSELYFSPSPNYSVSVDGEMIAFLGLDAAGQAGIYLNSIAEGELTKVIAAGDALDGRSVGDLRFGTDSFDAGRLAFVANFTDGTSGIYVATVGVPEPSSLILVAIGGATLTRLRVRRLPALAAQRDPGVPWEVLVFDNGSKDGTVEWLRREWGSGGRPAVRVVASPVNVGFCAANNRLVEGAEGDAVALLNNDTRPRPEWLAALVAALAGAPADVAAVYGMLVDWAGERVDVGGGVMYIDGHAFQLGFRRPLAGPGAAEVPADGAELPFACGGNLLVRRQSFLAAGGFDESYFAYLEDVDLGWRLWAGGERVLFARDAVVHHRSSATSDLLGLYNRGFHFERNALLTAFKNYEEGLWQRMMPAILLAFAHRTQHLLVHANPGGASLALDPYAGHIADTAAPGAVAATGATAAAVEPPARLADHAEPPARLADLPERWRRYGTVELGRRLAARLGREIASRRPRLVQAPAPPPVPLLTDERTVAQLRAGSWLLAHLDGAAESRRRVQSRRRRPDADYLARFPPYLVPTYPGDAELFASPGFRSLLPDEPELVVRRLDEVMAIG
jgi:GT2 family glycosyltransferase